MKKLGRETCCRSAASRVRVAVYCAVAWLTLGPFACAAPAADPPGQPARTTSGKAFTGELVAADASRLTFRVTGGGAATTETVPLSQLLRWGDFVDSSRGPQILLADGGVLIGEPVTIDAERLVVKSVQFGEVVLPRQAVVAIVFHPSGDAHQRDRSVAKALAGTRRERIPLDDILLDNGDELSGTAAWHDKQLTVETDAGRVELEPDQISAIHFGKKAAAASGTGPRGPSLVVGFRDGSRLPAGALATDAKGARLTLAGVSPAVTLSCETSAIVGLQTLGGDAVYLSDLEPVGYKHIPFLQLDWPYGTDRNAEGDLLRAGGRLFLKGLGMHSASRLTYDVNRPAKRLEALLALDSSAGQKGSVVYRVFVDSGDGHWEPRFTSPTVRGGDAPVPMSVDISGAKRISLLVEFADRGDELDHADWLEAATY